MAVGSDSNVPNTVLTAWPINWSAETEVRLTGSSEDWLRPIMVTVAELEAAIEHLPIAQVRGIPSHDKRSAEVFVLLDEEEGGGDQWHGTQSYGTIFGCLIWV